MNRRLNHETLTWLGIGLVAAGTFLVVFWVVVFLV